MTARFLDRLPAPLHIAHRGGAALYPENTLLAFEAAVRVHGTDVIETDVHLSADGEVMVCHDETLDRCTDADGPVAARTAAELAKVDAGYRFSPDGGATFPYRDRGLCVPRFAELLRAFPEMAVNVDLKSRDPRLVEAFAKVVREAGAVDRICCGSEDDDVAIALTEALPEATHFYPTGPGTAFVLSALKGGEVYADPRFTVLDIPAEFGGMPLVTPRLVEAARRTGRWINVWTIDAPEQMHRLLDLGVGGIMTDRPDRLRAVLDARAEAHAGG